MEIKINNGKLIYVQKPPLSEGDRVEVIGRAMARIGAQLPVMCDHCMARPAAPKQKYCLNEGCISAREFHRPRVRSLSTWERFEIWANDLGENQKSWLVLAVSLFVGAIMIATIGFPFR